MLMQTKKVLTIALAAVALTTASVAFAGDAFATGGGRGGKHFHVNRGVVFHSTPVVVSSCWKWINFKKVWICH